jgi:hypothetical protein
MKMKFNYLLGTILALTLSVRASQITNSVNITTNLVFSLRKHQSVGPQSEFKSDDEIIWGLVGTSTNYIGYRHCPSGNFDFHLFDENGNELSKTIAGKDLTATPGKPTRGDLVKRHFMPYFVDKKAGEFHWLFRPDDMFVITNKGIYDLEVRIRLCVIMTNGAPDLKAMTDWRNSTLLEPSVVKDFGILTSAPLRVKVIKE